MRSALESVPVLARLTEFRWQLSFVALAGLAVRVWSVAAWQRHFPVEGDQIYYHFGGRALAGGEGFLNPFLWDNGSGVAVPSAQHPPLYTTYLGLWSAVGVDSATGHKLVSCLLGAALIVVVAFVARRIAGANAGIAAAVCAAVYPVLWVNDGGLAAESLYALFIGLVLLFSYRLWDSPSFGEAAGLGAMVALAALTRAEAMALFPLLVLPLVIVLDGIGAVQRAKLLAVAGAVGVVVLAPWMIRNLTTFEEPVLFSTGSGFVLETANCDATYEGQFLGYWHESCQRPETWLPGRFASQEEAAEREATIEKAKREVGLEYMREHADRLPVVMAARIGRMWEVYAPNQTADFNALFERRGRLPTRTGQLAFYVLAPLSVSGLVVMRRRQITIVPFVALAISVTFTAAVSFGITRYRIALDVGLTVLAGIALTALYQRIRERERDRAGVRDHAGEEAPT